MLSNCGEAQQGEQSEITFLDLHHQLPALFSVCLTARGEIRGLTYIWMRLKYDVAGKAKETWLGNLKTEK